MSVLLPTYNRAGFFRKALESALAQDYPRLEIVVSDNASTDATASLKETYAKDPRVRWYRNPENIGLAENWRKLFYEYARSDYVKILADDDYLGNPRHLSEAADLIVKHEVGVVFAGAGSYDDATGTLVDRSWDLPERLTPAWWIANLGRRERGKTLFPNLTTGGVFHRERARSLRAFIDPVFGMDYQLGFELMLSGPSGYLKGVQVVERKHPDNDSFTASLDTVLGCLKLYDRVLACGLKHDLPEADVRRFCRRFSEVLTRGFVLYAWSRERGVSLASARALYQTLSAVDPALARAIATSPGALARFFFGGSPRRQEFLRRAYYKMCLWRDALRRRAPTS